MKTKIKEAVRNIILHKEREGEAFPAAHSIEIAHRLKMNAQEVELIAKDIDGITTHLTINGAYYETSTI